MVELAGRSRHTVGSVTTVANSNSNAKVYNAHQRGLLSTSNRELGRTRYPYELKILQYLTFCFDRDSSMLLQPMFHPPENDQASYCYCARLLA